VRETTSLPTGTAESVNPRWGSTSSTPAAARPSGTHHAGSTGSGYATGRSRAFGPTAPLWHAVEVHRLAGELDGASELTVCGVLARIVPGRRWPTAARDVCPVCLALGS